MKKLLTICFSLIFLCFSMTACTSSSASGDLVCSECETKITKNSNFCSSCGASIENEADDSEIETSGRTYNWDEVCLSSYLPEPKSEYGIVQTNSPDDLYMIVDGTSYKTYQDYVESCKEFGYDIDTNDSNGTYEAFSDDAGRLSVEYFSYDKAMHISLEILVSGTYRWHELYFAELLPTPESKSGNVHNNNDARCDLYVGDISKDSFAAYVEKCKERDFTLDSQEYEEYYFAKNPDGYELTIEYYGCDVIYIEIYDPYWEERDTVSISVNADSNTDNTDIGSVELVLENDM